MIGDLEDIVNIIRALLHREKCGWQQGKKKRCRSNAFLLCFRDIGQGKTNLEKFAAYLLAAS